MSIKRVIMIETSNMNGLSRKLTIQGRKSHRQSSNTHLNKHTNVESGQTVQIT